MSVLLVDSAPSSPGVPVIIAPYLSTHTWSRGGVVLNDRGAWPRYWVLETGLRDASDISDHRDELPGAHGETPRHSVRRGKTVPYSGVVEGRTRAELWVARDRLLAAFAELNPEGQMAVELDGQFPLAMGDGTLARAPAVTYDARPLQVTCPDVQPRELPDHYALDFSLSLRMSDARLLETVQQGPIALPINGAAVTVTSPGTADSDPIFTFTGPFTVVQVYNDTLGVTWRLPYTAAAGEVVIADFAARTVLSGVNDRDSFVDYAVTDWWDETTPGLVPGNNAIRLAMTGNGTGSAGDIRYYPAHH